VAELNELLAGPTLRWMPLLTLVMLLADHPWRKYMLVGTASELFGRACITATVVGLLFGDVAASSWFWYALSACHAAWIISVYSSADNHDYLWAYWCLALAVALQTGGTAGEGLIARNAELLIGLCFGIAVCAKLLSNRYRDGSFFAWQLVDDPRFLALASTVGGLTAPVRRKHIVARRSVQCGVSTREYAPVPGRLRRLAFVLTWWTIAIEGTIAIAFLAPGNSLSGWSPAVPVDWVRVGALSVFAVTTFTFVAVPAFGQILLLMALATTEDQLLRGCLLVLALGLTLLAFVPGLATRLAFAAQRGQPKRVADAAFRPFVSPNPNA
jgi:hypothetical protein